MQVRLNKTTSLNCGDGTDPGDFTVPLLDVNPFYYEFLKSAFNNPANPLYQQARQAYPHVWTRFEATVLAWMDQLKAGLHSVILLKRQEAMDVVLLLALTPCLISAKNNS